VIISTAARVNAQNFEAEKAYFEEVIYIGQIENEFAREKGTSIAILKNAKVDIKAIIEQDIAETQQ
jgi:hypothetical protein